MTIKKPVLGKYGFWTKDSIFVEVKAHNPKEAYLKAKSKPAALSFIKSRLQKGEKIISLQRSYFPKPMRRA